MWVKEKAEQDNEDLFSILFKKAGLLSNEPYDKMVFDEDDEEETSPTEEEE